MYYDLNGNEETASKWLGSLAIRFDDKCMETSQQLEVTVNK